jgi:hypothetical protein
MRFLSGVFECACTLVNVAAFMPQTEAKNDWTTGSRHSETLGRVV